MQKRMIVGVSFTIEFTSAAEADLKWFKRNDQRFIARRIEELLSTAPGLPSRNRKRLLPNDNAQWELRLDRIRVFYDIEEDTKTVVIIAVGRKDRNRLIIGGREFNL